jgi:hypothetical protein
MAATMTKAIEAAWTTMATHGSVGRRIGAVVGVGRLPFTTKFMGQHLHVKICRRDGLNRSYNG